MYYWRFLFNKKNNDVYIITCTVHNYGMDYELVLCLCHQDR